MSKKPPSNLQEFVKEYLFDREVELLKKETEIQKLQSQISKIKENIKDVFKGNIADYARYGCMECCKLLFRGGHGEVVCGHCVRVAVCEKCAKITGGTMIEIPYLQEYWVCDECYEERIPPGCVSYTHGGKNSERNGEQNSPDPSSASKSVHF